MKSNIIDEGLGDRESLLGEWLQPAVGNGSLANVSLANGTLDTDVPAESGFQHAFVYIPIQIAVSFAAMIANLLTLMALGRVRSKFQPHLILVVNLTLSDMLFGLRNVIIRSIVLGFQFDDKLRVWFSEICVRGLIRVAGSAIYTCTYINLLAIAFDLYFAIMSPFRYQRVITRRRTINLSVSLWILSGVLAAANYWVAIGDWASRRDNSTFCEVRERHTKIDVYVHLGVVYLGLVAMTYLYIRIFIEVRRCARSTPGLPVKQQQSVKHNKRKLVTSLLVLVTFLVAWLPNGIFTTLYFILPEFGGPTVSLLGMYFATLPMLNSLGDPVIYAIRLDKVRIGFRKLCRCRARGRRRGGGGRFASDSTELMNLSVNSAADNRHDSTELGQKILLPHRPGVVNGDYRRTDGDGRPVDDA